MGEPLRGRALVMAMCLAQLGSLLPHVTLPAVMAEHLMPLWGLNAAQAGLMAAHMPSVTRSRCPCLPALPTVLTRG
jgi:hypothetical protein